MTSTQFARFVATIRFEQIDPDLGECWIWTGSRRAKEYGRFCEGKNKLAHRVAYAHFIGPIPDAIELDHLCRNKLCVNPRHLEAVPHAMNVRRGLVPGNMHSLGMRHSDETRALISRKKIASMTPEHSRLYSEQSRRMWAARKRQGLGGTHTTPHSDEAKRRMSEARRAWWSRKREAA